MPHFSFRIRFHRSPTDTVNIDAPRWEWQASADRPPVVLSCHPEDKAIKDSQIWVFKSDGWPSEEAAVQAADKYIPALVATLARLRVGADFGTRAPKSGFFRAGLAMLEEQSGFRVLNDVHGLMFYESEPPPRFGKFGAKGFPEESEKFFTLGEIALIHQHLWALSTNAG
jgi:hypothetical protein